MFTISIIISDFVISSEAFHNYNKSSQNRKSYPIPYKLMIIEESKSMSASEVARKHKISKSMVVRWRQDEVKIRNALESHGGQFKRINIIN